MGIRHYKPTTPGRRGATVSDFKDLTPGYEVEKSENPYEATLNALRVSTEEDLIVAAGSFYNISEIRRAVKESEEQQS